MATELRTSFRDQLDEVRHGIAALGAVVTELVPRSTEVLLDGDLEGAEYVILGDEQFDVRSRHIEAECFRLIALQAPVASDLRELVSGIKIIADVERSADLCVNICKAARRIYSHDLDANLRGVIQKMGTQAALLFKESTEAYLQSDAARAGALRDMDAYLDALQRQFVQIIFESHASGSIDLQVAVQLAVVARFYERIGDHAVNVSDHTMYIIDGHIDDHPYPESGNEVPKVARPPASR
jgi:phosphate transport system protein